MADENSFAVALIRDVGARARQAAAIMARANRLQKANALLASSDALRRAAQIILDANACDIADATSSGMASAMLDRLSLDASRLAAIADSVAAVALLPDHVGEQFDARVRPNGLRLERVRVPLGVIGIIYESRPNVTADAAVLCLMSGNAAILRGGSEASRSNAAIHAALVEGIVSAGLPSDAVQLISTTDRAVVGAMLGAHGLIDVIIPRGGKSLVARVQAEARVPVLAHLDGINHTYVDGAANPDMASAIVVDAKMRRTGVCGAMETLLIDRAFPDPRRLIVALIDSGCEVRGSRDVAALDARVHPAAQADWDTEYLDAVCAIAFVAGVNGAIDHIGRHGSAHTEAIVTEDAAVAERFLRDVDAAIVMWNASTQFADGGEFGLGAEIGIATGRLHARGPVALEGLTTYKWIVRGLGQVRG